MLPSTKFSIALSVLYRVSTDHLDNLLQRRKILGNAGPGPHQYLTSRMHRGSPHHRNLCHLMESQRLQSPDLSAFLSPGTLARAEDVHRLSKSEGHLRERQCDPRASLWIVEVVGAQDGRQGPHWCLWNIQYMSVTQAIPRLTQRTDDLTSSPDASITWDL